MGSYTLEDRFISYAKGSIHLDLKQEFGGPVLRKPGEQVWKEQFVDLSVFDILTARKHIVDFPTLHDSPLINRVVEVQRTADEDKAKAASTKAKKEKAELAAQTDAEAEIAQLKKALKEQGRDPETGAPKVDAADATPQGHSLSPENLAGKGLEDLNRLAAERGHTGIPFESMAPALLWLGKNSPEAPVVIV